MWNAKYWLLIHRMMSSLPLFERGHIKNLKKMYLIHNYNRLMGEISFGGKCQIDSSIHVSTELTKRHYKQTVNIAKLTPIKGIFHHNHSCIHMSSSSSETQKSSIHNEGLCCSIANGRFIVQPRRLQRGHHPL